MQILSIWHPREGKQIPGTLPTLTGKMWGLRRLLSVMGWITLAVLLSGVALGQSFDASRYLSRCLSFEASGAYDVAAQECQNALELRSNYLEAQLALARIEVKSGQLGRAERSLNELSKTLNSAEPLLLLAQIAFSEERWSDVRSYLGRAEGRLRTSPDAGLSGQRYYYLGRLEARVGNYQHALDHYAKAINEDPQQARYHLADAEVRFLLGSPDSTSVRLENYLRQVQDGDDPKVRPYLADIYSLLARASWSQGEYDKAGSYFTYAASSRSSQQTEAKYVDQWQRGLVALSQGDTRSANLSFRDAFISGSLLSRFLFNMLPWLLLLIVFVGLQLFGESLVAPTSSLEVVEGARPWNAKHAYRILFISILLSLVVALLYSLLYYRNVLAIATPLQRANVQAIFLISFALSSLVASILTLQRLGWVPMTTLLTPSSNPVRGASLPIAIVVGGGLTVLTLAYLYFAPEAPGLSGFFLRYQPITVMTVLASLLLPLTALFFHVMCQKSFAERYTPTIAMCMVACLYPLLMAAPVALLLLIGLALAFFYSRTHNGLYVLVAWAVFQISLPLVFMLSSNLRVLTL